MGKCCSKLWGKSQSSLDEPLNHDEIDKIFQKTSLTRNSLNIRTQTSITRPPQSLILSQEISKKDFEIIKTIGRGSFGKVLLVKYSKDLHLYAMKVLKKDFIKQTNQVMHTKTEREILARVDHEFIVQLKFAFQTLDKLYLVTDFMQGGELFYHLHREGRFSEIKTRFYICEFILAIEYLHQNQIIYRDLKPENILLDGFGHLKLADFGLSKFVLNNDNNRAYTICGTPEYLAPEILSGVGYDKTVDWWSLGCLIFEMLCGISPFKYNKDVKLEMKLYEKKIDIPNFFSESAKNIVLSLLQVDPKTRLGNGKDDAESIKKHEFFKDIDWDEVLKKKIVSPFKPVLKSREDLKYFDKLFTDEAIDTPADKSIIRNKNNKAEASLYDKFTYVKPFDDLEKSINYDSTTVV